MEILVDGYSVLVDSHRYEILGCPPLSINWDEQRQSIRYVRAKLGKGKALHRLVFGDIPFGFVVDHINGNPLDNRLENLRLATVADNNRNALQGTKGKSKYPGVSWYSATGKWRAALGVDGQKRHLGYFDCEIKAAKVAKAYSIKMHGEFSIYHRIHEDL